MGFFRTVQTRLDGVHSSARLREHREQQRERQLTRRALLVGGAQLGLLGLLGGRLYHLQAVEQSRFALLADENRIAVQMLEPRRGRILDRLGRELARNDDEFRLTVVPDLAGDLSSVLDQVAELVPLSQEDRERVLRTAGRQSRTLPILVTSDVTWEQFSKTNVLAPQLPGLRAELGSRRKYFRGADAGHILGYVGKVEKYEIASDPVLHLPGVRVGKTGVERGLDDRLRGRGGNVKLEVDARGRIIRQLEEVESRPGADVRLSVDIDFQARVLQRLERERRAAAVAMDVNTGELLAIGSAPRFDPTPLIGGVDEAFWQSLKANPDRPLTNRATRGQYPPASTFKMVTALAGLEAGLINRKTKFSCRGKTVLADSTFRCWNRGGHGPVNLHRALRESCDVYFYELARRLGITRLANMARRLGFGQTFDCGLPLQKSGVVPDPDWKMSRFERPWFGGETILAGIGQGFVLATPLQLAVMTARLATGRAVTPTVIGLEPGEARPAPALNIAREYLDDIQRGMWAVVNERAGTGSKARLPGETVMAGKTGTAQVTRKSSRLAQADLAWEERDHSLFVGYAPYDKPRFAVSVVVEHGGGGGAVAAPLARDILQDLLATHDRTTPGVLVGDADAQHDGPPLPKRRSGGIESDERLLPRKRGVSS